MLTRLFPRIVFVGAITLWCLPAVAIGPSTEQNPEAGQYAGTPNSLCSQLERARTTYERIASSGGWPSVESGRAPKPGDVDPRMAKVRDRLKITGDIAEQEVSSTPDAYDATLEAGIRRFQARHGLTIDGVLGPGTLAALNVPVQSRVGQLQEALDRCRTDLGNLSGRFIIVNIAGFRVLYVENGNVTWSSRVIVGAPYTKTPIFRANMEYVELNPTWTVPQSIIAKEIGPKIARDPRYLEKEHMKRVGDEIVQSPGPHNALGRIKLMLPNEHDVYLHDTPTKSLFKKATRAFSHGCVRVEKPVELAALALNDPQWTPQSLQAAIDKGATRRIQLQSPVPVIVTSWPATADREGAIEFLPDLYRGTDQAGGEDRSRSASAK